LEVPVIDLTSHSEADRELKAKEIAAEEAQTPFDLDQGPLLSTKIVRLAPQNHLLLLTMHHIVSDAWSAGIFVQELGKLYAAFLKGEPSPLPEVGVQYGDYAAWLRDFLLGEVLVNL